MKEDYITELDMFLISCNQQKQLAVTPSLTHMDAQSGAFESLFTARQGLFKSKFQHAALHQTSIDVPKYLYSTP